MQDENKIENEEYCISIVNLNDKEQVRRYNESLPLETRKQYAKLRKMFRSGL